MSLLIGGDNLSAHDSILFIRETGTLTGVLLHQHGMTGGHDGSNFYGSADNAVLAFLNVFQNTKNHF